jgi:Fe-Mn family superoxide dismutase
METYILPELSYKYNELEPVISEEQLRVHHDKHHLAYINAANSILEKYSGGIGEEEKKNAARDLSFNVGGHILHSLFWPTMAPPGKGGEPGQLTLKSIEKDFINFENFKDIFSKNAISVQGSGWSALSYDPNVDRLLITQIEKHDVNLYPALSIVMVLDVWEHAYYLDYQNNRANFVNEFYKILNWQEVENRLRLLKTM